MTALFVAVCVLVLVFLLWCVLLLPRRGQPGWEKLAGVRYAHRGLHDLSLGIPENSLAAFRRAVDQGLGAELDVHLMADGNLAVVHDSDLTRVCGKSVQIEDLTAADLKDYPLQGTAETIPLLEDVLAVFAGRRPLVVELKVERGNAVPLTDKTMSLLEQWDGDYCLESFHPSAVRYLREKYPQAIRGQLSENFRRDKQVGGLSRFQRLAMTWLLTTVLTRPDFIAYRWEDRRNLSLRLMKRLYGVHVVYWTIRDPGALAQAEAQGATGIFENFVPKQ